MSEFCFNGDIVNKNAGDVHFGDVHHHNASSIKTLPKIITINSAPTPSIKAQRILR